MTVSKHNELAKNTLIIAAGKISTQFISFLLLPLYTAYLTTGDFGTVDLIMTYVLLLAPLLTLQLEMAAFRYLIDARKNEDRKKEIISNSLHIVIVAIIVFAVTYLGIQQVISIPHAGLIFTAIIATVVIGLFLQFARGLGDNVKFAIGGVVAGVMAIVANIVFIVGFGMGVEGMLAATVLANITSSLYLFFSLGLYRYISFYNSDHEVKRQLLGYSAPLVPNGIAWWAINAADRTIIAIFLGVASNGIFAVAYRFPLIFMGLFSFFGMSWTESASMHIDSKDRDKFFSETMNASVRLFGSLGLGIIAIVPLIFDFLINERYREAYVYIPILIVGAFFNAVVGLYSAVYIAKKMTKQVASTSIIAAVISVGFTLTFINSIGIYAAAFAMPIAFLTMAIYRHYDIKKYVTITYQSQTFLLLGLMYTAVISLYYLNNTYGNIANIILAIIMTVSFNRTVVSSITDKVIGMHRRRRSVLTAEQELREDLL